MLPFHYCCLLLLLQFQLKHYMKWLYRLFYIDWAFSIWFILQLHTSIGLILSSLCYCHFQIFQSHPILPIELSLFFFSLLHFHLCWPVLFLFWSFILVKSRLGLSLRNETAQLHALLSTWTELQMCSAQSPMYFKRSGYDVHICKLQSNLWPEELATEFAVNIL